VAGPTFAGQLDLELQFEVSVLLLAAQEGIEIVPIGESGPNNGLVLDGPELIGEPFPAGEVLAVEELLRLIRFLFFRTLGPNRDGSLAEKSQTAGQAEHHQDVTHGCSLPCRCVYGFPWLLQASGWVCCPGESSARVSGAADCRSSGRLSPRGLCSAAPDRGEAHSSSWRNSSAPARCWAWVKPTSSMRLNKSISSLRRYSLASGGLVPKRSLPRPPWRGRRKRLPWASCSWRTVSACPWA